MPGLYAAGADVGNVFNRLYGGGLDGSVHTYNACTAATAIATL